MKKNAEDKRRYYPLTHAQKRIYYDEKIHPGTSAGTQAFIVRYKEILDKKLLEQAISKVILKNEGFRLRMVEIEHEPAQYIAPFREIYLDEFDFSGPNSECRMREWVKKITETPIELWDSDLFYFAYIRFNESETGYYMKFHHVTSDGGSYPFIFSEINQIYEDLKAGKTIDESLNLSYLPYIAEEQEYLNSPDFEKDKEFWHNTMLPLPEITELTPKTGSPENTKGNVFVTSFPDKLRTDIHEYWIANKTSPFKLILSGLTIYAARVTGLDEVVIAAANHNRQIPSRQKVVGMYVSTILFRVKVDRDMPFNGFVQKTGNEVINYALKNHQRYPFDRLATGLREITGEEIGYLLDLFISGHGDVEKENYTFEHIYQGYQGNALTIHINYNNKYLDGILELEYEYQVERFSEPDIRQLHQGIINVLTDAIANPEKQISEIEIMSAEEKEQILYEFNDTEADYPGDKTIHELFEARVEKTPGNIALTYRGTKLTYRELNKKANQLARVLREKGVKADYIVGIMVERSLEMMVGILGILKAGGAYLPLAPGYSEDHIRYLLRDSKNKLLLTREKYSGSTSTVDYDGELIYVDDELPYRGEEGNLELVNASNDLACIIYTFGSPGQTKGVMIEHASLINTLFSLQGKYPVNESDIYLLKTPFQFPSSVLELFGWFWEGGSLYILEEGGENDPQKLLEAILYQEITHVHLAPTMCTRLLNELILAHQQTAILSHLKYLLLSREPVIPISVERFKRLNPDVVIENLYGIPEISAYACTYSLSDWQGSWTGLISIGRPIANTKIYILNFKNCDRRGGKPELLPVGIPGELCISGIGLARGYLYKEEYTDEKFIDNPFSSGEKLYRTGELARWLPDGNIELFGLIDQQVKIRGVRIDKTEIENQLLKQEEIKEAVVVVLVSENNTGTYLYAYIVSDTKLDKSIVRERLAKSLPSQMIPTYFIQIKEIPLTLEGRADRVELVDLRHDPHQVKDMLAQIEAEVLNKKKEDIDLDANFFKLGGHSLKAAQMKAKIEKVFNVNISMAELFKRPTLRQLSEYLTESIEVKYSSVQPAELKEYYPQSSAQKRLYFLQQMEEESTVYNIQMMDIYCKGLKIEALESAFKILLKRHESLRTSFHVLDGEALQKIHDYEDVESSFGIEYYETTEEGLIYAWDPRKKGRRTQVECKGFEDVIKGFVKPFELGKLPLLRIGFIKIWGKTKILMLDMHHIIADAISLEILAKELWEVYDEEELTLLRLQYKDFSQWLSSENRVEAVKEQEEFWLKEFAGEIPPINLPTDYPRPAALSFEGDTLQFEIGNEEMNRLNKITQERGETLYMVLFAVYNVLLAKISGQEDIVVGTITAGRGHDDLQNIVGMFVNTLALRIYPEGEKIFEDFLMDVKLTAFAAFENQDYPFEQLVSKVAPRQETNRNPLFDVAFGLENETDPTGYLMEVAIPDKSKPYDFATKNSKFDMTLVCVELEDEIECTIEYKTTLFKRQTIQRFAKYFKKIVASLCGDLRQKIGEIEIISEEEKDQILFDFNDTRAEYPRDKTIHELFEERNEKTPANIALTYNGDRLTYLQVNEKANQLARLLREIGVKPENMVGIMVERSMEMIIGIMAILKAGGAYLPIDTNYPEDLIHYLFKDSASRLLLTQEKFVQFSGNVDFGGDVINLNDESLYQGEIQNLDMVNSPNDLAYIIYTSGSTGKPKGVMIEHVSAVNILLTLDKLYPLDESDAYLLKTAFLFDVSVSEIFGWFWRGGRLTILEPGLEKDPVKMIDKIAEEKITHINFVPSLFNLFVSMLDEENISKLSSLKYIFLAGEAIWPESIHKFRAFNTNVRIENIYGPTESTIYASWYPVAEWEGCGSVSIGKPIDNLKLYILSSDDKAKPSLQPVGIAGELTISGVGLARGYLNRAKLTSEKFVDNPFAEAEKRDKTFKKLYHTGDLTRWSSEGNIEYMGRIDHQVKVRGFRIELGEIEIQLLKIPGIKEAVVIAREDREGEKYLCAYIISDEELDMSSVRNTLLKELPEYMIPSYFVPIEEIPLNPNGKLDRKALPVPSAEKVTREYTAPTNEIEETLAAVWGEVLGSEKVGIDDNFFEIGGDSIKAIQIVSKLQKHKWKLEVGQMFSHKTIRDLAKHLKPVEAKKLRAAEQGIVEGSVELTPIQKWLFSENLPRAHHFNQSVTLYRKEGFDETHIIKVFKKIVEHHDALRMVYKFDGEVVVQENRGIKEKLFHLEVILLGKDIDETAVIKEESLRIQKSINLQQGPLVKLGLFKGAEGDYLVMVIHHLVVDGISWRILLEDFEIGYLQAVAGNEIRFQEKTDSFKYWSQKLTEYSGTGKLLKELPYWREIEETRVRHIPVDHEIPREKRTFKHHDLVTVVLAEEQTHQLLTRVNRTYNTEINDILLTALGLAVKHWAGIDKILVNLEGHGREMVVEDVDITRTVGWFTTQYPVIMDMEKSEDLSYSIRNVKETLRCIPHKGIGYGILKYLTPSDKKGDMRFSHEPEILFNYLGKFAGETFGVIDGLSGLTDLNLEDWWNPELEIEQKIDIEGIVDGEELKLYFFYNKQEYQRDTIERLTETFKSNLEQVIDHCRTREKCQLTPSDLDCKNISVDDFDKMSDYIKHNIGEDMEIEWIYPLSPMQNGMFYHSLRNKESNAYFEQFVFPLHGELDQSLFEDSINTLIERHNVLRTIFAHEGLDEPLQIVLKKREMRLHYEDISHLNEEGQAEYLEAFRRKDQERKFDLPRDLLLRFALFKTAPGEHRLLFTFHHTIMDGWCLAIILKELKRVYRLLEQGEPAQLEFVTPYSEYIRWLKKQDIEEGLQHWVKYLGTYDEPAVLTKPGRVVKENQYQLEEYHFTIDEELTSAINKLAGRCQATISTVLQSVWGVLLQKYNNKGDVVFGTIVSGRPDEIAGFDQMVGLFINMIPVRIKSREGQKFSHLLKDLQVESVLLKKYEYLPIAEIQSHSPLRGDLIDHILVFENYPVEEELGNPELGFTVGEMEAYEQTNYDFNIIIMPRDCLYVNFSYNALVYESDLVEYFSLHFEKVLNQVVHNPDIPVEEIEIITEREKKKILYEFNDTVVDYPRDKTIYQVFEEQVEKTPDNIAVVFWDKRLTYREFNERSNQLARILREKGIKADNIVAILVERCLEMMIGIFAIQKAGGAYLPIEPGYPKNRIDYLLQDSSTRFMLTLGKFVKLIETIEFNGETIDLEEESLYQGERGNLHGVNSPRDIAYIIYTSGSTGKPKGVMIEHVSVINRINWMQKFYPLYRNDVILQKTTYVFDVSVWELFWWSFQGSSQYLLIPGGEKDPAAIVEAIEKNNITTMHFVPSMLNMFLGYIEANDNALYQGTSLKQVFASGEALTLHQAEKFNELVYKRTKKAVLINLYGPTEATVDVSYYNCPTRENPDKIPIGKPIDNTKLLVVDHKNGLQAIGVSGELCITGDQLARGYLNRPLLTTEKFMENPFQKQEGWGPMYKKLYRTGDLSHWLPDGNIEYLGRIDFQVKIRGFRIETGEIENKLLEQPNIKEAVVIAKDDGRGDKYLCAYLISAESLDMSSVRSTLSRDVPDYMVPSFFVQIDKIPLTPNGKLDRRALPEPEAAGLAAEYVAPTNEVEEKLVEIWAEVLGIEKEKLGIDDNYFEIGGDSLKTILISGRLAKQRLSVNVNDLFSYPTIRKLAKHCTQIQRTIHQGIVTGEVELAPMQKWFFEKDFPGKHHFNHCIMRYRSDGFDEEIIKQVFIKIAQHHDALRMVYDIGAGSVNIVQRNRGLDQGKLFDMEIFDYRDKKDIENELAREAKRIQQGIDLKTGPLVKLALFRTHRGDYLLIVVHRIAADDVSWKILLEDFENGYRQAENGEEIRFPDKTDSFKYWVHQLIEYADSPEALKELDYWKQLEDAGTGIEKLPKDHVVAKETKTFKNRETVTIDLGEEVEKLLKEVNWVYDTEINDILLTALAMTLNEWSGNEKALISLEGEGREGISQEIDVSRTIGWFAYQYPLLIDLKPLADKSKTGSKDREEELANRIKQVKEILRRVPNKGMGYGILKYLTSQEKKEGVTFKLQPEIRFKLMDKE
ncbi:MAG: amino acid adenylation domain-containing protein [Candidatus Aminicenantes bacterium]|nr:amino acid adenylation domain-containing protein [Candidatus Aminicenantes bacterium]NIM83334.1 amino acid adenylation domain-containing protein [Candidatus Aminicenantes bacterium]NIN22693.1 amino acid adenylation domain-containing protein [Candidatus Aminicenantes bacterium]NIN46453.1 amino acid adenylation domain-containing protein [Candidatus Aminicenantes bacterium]NIN89305.1 amino acid adenylation domain-containing protein [Candidatus Aminicenantes bacterium]